MNVVARRVIVVLAVIAFLLIAIVYALNLRSPSLDAERLPRILPAGEPAVIPVAVKDAKGAQLRLDVTPQDLEILQEAEKIELRWDNPPPGTHIHQLTLFALEGEHETKVSSVEWKVEVQRPEKPGTLPDETQPDETIPDVATPDETTPDETTPEETKPEQPQPDETQPDEAKPEETQPEEVKPDAPQPDETKPEETQPDVPEPPKADPIEALPALPRVEDEAKVQVEGKMAVYGRSHPNAQTIEGYVIDKLGLVNYTYQVAGDNEALADAQIEALLRIGASPAAGDSPFNVKLNPAGGKALARRNLQQLRLPVEIWGLILRTTSKVAGVVNRGQVTWRIGRYEPDPGGLVIDISREDVKP